MQEIKRKELLVSSALAVVAEGPVHDFESQRTVRAAVATRSVRGASDYHDIATFGLAFITQEWRINNDAVESTLQAGCRLALDRSRRQLWDITYRPTSGAA